MKPIVAIAGLLREHSETSAWKYRECFVNEAYTSQIANAQAIPYILPYVDAKYFEETTTSWFNQLKAEVGDPVKTDKLDELIDKEENDKKEEKEKENDKKEEKVSENELKVGDNLYIKDDSMNPSLSSKDRARGIAVLKALEQKASVISCASTGNAASSLACHAARMGLKCVILKPPAAN